MLKMTMLRKVRQSNGRPPRQLISSPPGMHSDLCRRDVPADCAVLCRRFNLSTHELLEKILDTLSLSTTAGRVDRSIRARFWDMYKAEAGEFHSDFLNKYNSELDISLIFVRG